MQDGDGLINVSGQASPNSAMSISPATSEVCSILDSEKNRKNSIKSENRTPIIAGTPNKNRSKNRSSQAKQSCANNVDRSDLDLDWRSGGSGTPVQRQLSADEDTNWRDHKPLNNEEELRGSTENSWRTIKSKNRKIQSMNFRALNFSFMSFSKLTFCFKIHISRGRLSANSNGL